MEWQYDTSHTCLMGSRLYSINGIYDQSVIDGSRSWLFRRSKEASCPGSLLEFSSYRMGFISYAWFYTCTHLGARFIGFKDLFVRCVRKRTNSWYFFELKSWFSLHVLASQKQRRGASLSRDRRHKKSYVIPYHICWKAPHQINQL